MSEYNKINLVKTVQSLLGLKVDGQDGPITWSAIISKLVCSMDTKQSVHVSNETFESIPKVGVSDKAYDLILKYEVGGGPSYYNKALKHPCYPGGASGVTIGIGYDMGYNSAAQFATDWKELLSDSDYGRLAPHVGKKSSPAKDAVRILKDISISWEDAEGVFKSNTLPRFIKETVRAFPGSDALHPDAFGALVSLVFNRGGSVVGDSRVEMNNIKKAITGEIKTSNLYDYIAGQIVAMKRLWIGKGLDGLLTRRDEEARLVKSCA
jgi:GH24 family phage-related lysozyme (muramidase)